MLPFSNLGRGSIPARNWVWEHALASGAERHWILDDNISNFFRLNRNCKTLALTGAMFRASEEFVDRYDNVALAGFHYTWLCKATQSLPAFYLNGRVYSCILIDNKLTHRWRGRYNEDTDLLDTCDERRTMHRALRRIHSVQSCDDDDERRQYR